jgi:PBP1b-binding outer membrane lipoprotein LpoB
MKAIKSMFAVCSLGILFSGCSQPNSSHENETSKIDSVEVAQAATVLKDGDINLVYSNYMELKNALVLSKSDQAQAAATKLANSLLKIDGCENTAVLTKHIAGSADLVVQRADFTAISSDIIALMKNADISSGTVFVQYCPMANSGKGGFWLASEKEINNPYYGDDMLNCGEVKEKFTKK